MRCCAHAVLWLAAVAAAGGCGGDRVQPERSESVAARPAPSGAATRASDALVGLPLRIIVIADLEGVLEPCGCTTRPLGGVDRLAAAVATLRKDAPDAIVIAVGDMFGPARAATEPARAQDALRDDAISAVLTRIGIDVLAPGEGDRAREPARVAALARATHAVLLGSGSHAPELDAMVASAALRAGRIELGVVARSATDAPELVASRIAALRARGVQHVIEYTQPGAEDTAAGPTRADVVVHGEHDQRPSWAVVAGGPLYLRPGHHAEALLAVDVWPGRLDRTASHIIDLDAHAPADPAVRTLLDQSFARASAHNAKSLRDHTPPAPAKGEPRFVGSRTCAACHTPAYAAWQSTPHARAFETLRARHREFDLDCIGCHVTGYQQAGGSSIARLDELKGVGCESCHGPGSAHTDNPQDKRHPMRRVVAESTCIACHDREHSDRFRYTEARARLLVPGHGQSAAP